MDVKLRGNNVKVSERIEDYALKKLEKLDRYLPGITEVWLDLSHQHNTRGGDLNIAQITVRHRRGAILRAEEKATNDFEIVINHAIDKMYRQIRRFKGKRARKKGSERYTASVEEIEMAEELPQVSIPEEDGTESSVLRRKNVTVTAMDEEEAIEQMELLGHSFFMFFNDETGTINVVYKRHNGGYGVLMPDVQ